jgi:solute carrier family 8 (sodium/calcium exchanger)
MQQDPNHWPYDKDGELCTSMFLPVGYQTWTTGAGVATVFFFFFVYLLMGLSVISNIFMKAIEVITSEEIPIHRQGASNTEVVLQRTWSPTIANLTLLSIAASAPAMMLTLVEVIDDAHDENLPGLLGPSTIVGSAAWNLFVVVGFAMWAPQDWKHKTLTNTRLFFVTGLACLFAFFWMVIVLHWSTPDQVDMWEAWCPIFFFIALVYYALITDPVRTVARATLDAKEVTNTLKVMNIDMKTQTLEDVKSELYSAGLVPTASLQTYKLNVRNMLSGDGLVFDPMLADIPSRKLSNAKTKRFKRLGSLSKIVPDPPRAALTGSMTQSAEFFRVSFLTHLVTVVEDKNVVNVEVVRAGSIDQMVAVNYFTIEATASAILDFKSTSGTLIFAPGELRKTISVEIIKDPNAEGSEYFFIHLSAIKDNTEIAPFNKCEVWIMDQDEPGDISLYQTGNLYIEPTKDQIVVHAVRSNGAKGEVSVCFRTLDGTARAGEDFQAIDTLVRFGDGETTQTLVITLVNPLRLEEKSCFYAELYRPLGGAKLGSNSRIQLSLKPDNMVKKQVETLTEHLRATSVTLLITDSWTDQFRRAVSPSANASIPQLCLHVLHIFWKVVFSTVPPTIYLRGWAAALVSAFYMAIVCWLLIDVTTVWGCAVGFGDIVMGVCFISVGVGLPDLFASIFAARQVDTQTIP